MMQTLMGSSRCAGSAASSSTCSADRQATPAAGVLHGRQPHAQGRGQRRVARWAASSSQPDAGPPLQPKPPKIKKRVDRSSLSLAPEGHMNLNEMFDESAMHSLDGTLGSVDLGISANRPVFKAGANTSPSGGTPADPLAAAAAAAAGVQLPAKGEHRQGEHLNLVRTTGLRRTPLGGGVKNATLRYDLPPPAIAVRNLIERAHFAHLCTVMSKMHHRRAGYPFGTLVDFACDGAGNPILCLSPLGIHTRNLAEDPRASIVVQMPGWTGLANARVTIFGDVFQVPQEQQDLAREVFTYKQAKDKTNKWVSGNFAFFRMHKITDIYFVGGFGTLQWVDVDEYISSQPDEIVLEDPDKTIHALNDKFGRSLRSVLSQGERPLQDAHVISVDQLGADVRVRKGPEYSVERIGFGAPVRTLDDAIKEMDRMLA